MAGIPSRPAEVKRDLGDMAVALRSVGGGGSASELRSDAGIFFGYGVEETLSRHIDLLVYENTRITLIPAAADTTASDTFSFPEDRYILNFNVNVTTNPLNFDSWRLNLQPFTATSGGSIGYGILADVAVVITTSEFPPRFIADMPLFVPAETDYIFSLRSNALGGCTGRLSMRTVGVPKGVRIPH